MPQTRIHIVGCGNIGRRLAAQIPNHKQQVTAWVNSDTSLRACVQLGLNTQQFDLDQPLQSLSLGNNSQLLYTIPPPPGGTLDTRIQAFLDNLDPGEISRFILISTSGVYGDCAGAWIDETTPVQPGADRAKRRADAESRVQNWASRNDIDYLILRVPGIYSADRLPLERLGTGAPMVSRLEAPWTNRIQADDLAMVCRAALDSDVSNEIINVADDAPSTMTDYFIAVADYAGLPRPTEVSRLEASKTMSPGMLSYMAESRRIDNSKMKRLLNVQLKYPSLREGLKRPT